MKVKELREQTMTREEYRKFLRDLEHDILSKYTLIGATNAKSVVSELPTS